MVFIPADADAAEQGSLRAAGDLRRDARRPDTIIIGLIGSGLVLSPIVSSITVVIWMFIFVFRGKSTRPE